jgi:hypothetical protein
LAEMRDDREVLVRLTKTLEALVELLAARLGPPRERG